MIVLGCGLEVVVAIKLGALVLGALGITLKKKSASCDEEHCGEESS